MLQRAGGVALVALLCFAVIGSAAAEASKPVTVMTRNVYLGGDFSRPLDATAGLSGFPALLAFGRANYTLRGIVDETDFPARARLLAREIAQRDPDLVGVQEVALWRHGPLQLDQIGVPNAQIVDYDFLALLLDALAREHVRYSAVSVQMESDVEGPAFQSLPGDPSSGDDRLTMRDVILKRDASDVKVETVGSGQYAARIPVQVAGAGFAIIRGYNWADIRAGAVRLRFVNTHLESESSLIALRQMQELLGGPADAPGRSVVVVCDCNSNPLNHTTKPTDPIPTPHSAPYDLITGPGGFADEWLLFAPASAGFTSGFNEFVNDPDLTGIDHRIDMVFGHSESGAPLPVDHGWIVGNDFENRTASGLWPSDHLGVVIRLRP
jgi:hypothetical protein